MVFDLRGALLKKEEFESARLADFEFRLRARTMRLLADKIGRPQEELVAQIALKSDEAILADNPQLAEHYPAAQAEARRQLIGELGDPTPTKLA